MLKKIKRKDCLLEYPFFPLDNSNGIKEDYFYPRTVANYVLTVHSKSTKSHVKNLANELVNMVEALRIDSLIFLGNTPRPWLYQDNDYKPVKAALQYLVENKASKRFNGALEVYTSELFEFFVHLFWISRCNAALPSFYFMDVDSNFIGNICRYGNLHLDVFHDKSIPLIHEAISKTKFEFKHQSLCGTGLIKGRQTIA